MSEGRAMGGTRLATHERTRRLLNAVLAALLVLTTLAIIPSVANAEGDTVVVDEVPAETPPTTIATNDAPTQPTTPPPAPDPTEPTYRITLVKRVCDSYAQVHKNLTNPNHLHESLEPIGAPITWATVTPAHEEAESTCAPKAGWPFSIGTGISAPRRTDPPGSLSQVRGNYGTSIITQASTPLLDEFGVPTGASLAGAVTIELTPEQAARAENKRRLWISEGTNGPNGGVIPADYGFGILRCGSDIRNADNAEWVTFPNGSTHVFCYAYNVGMSEPRTPSLSIDKTAVDIDGAPYAHGNVAHPGQVINYEITVTNTGDAALTDVVVSDPDLDAPGLNCAWPNGAGELAVGDGQAVTLDDGDTVVCTGSHTATSADADNGDFHNTSTAESAQWRLSETDDETVPVAFVYTITFVKRVCNSYEDVLKNGSNPDNIAEAPEPLGGGQVTWHAVTPADEEASTDCQPESGWDFSMGSGIATPTPPGTLSQVTGNFGTAITTQDVTPLLDAQGQDTGETLEGAVTIELTDEQAALAARRRRLWVSEGLNGPDGAIIPDGYGFGILRCANDNRNADNVEWITYRGNATHVFCYAYNVALDPQITVTKTVDKPAIVAKDTVEFTIDIENTGNLTLTDLTLDDTMTFDGGSTHLTNCEIPGATTLAPGATTHASCTVVLDSSTHGENVLNTVTATAVTTVGDEVTDSANATVAITPPSVTVLGGSCISTPLSGYGFSLDEPLVEWSTTDWGPTFDPNTDTLELRIWSNDQDPSVDAPAITYEVPWDSDLLGQEPYASVAGAPDTDMIMFDGADGFLYWPGYDNTGWLGPDNGLAGIVYPGAEWRPAAYQFAFNPETDVQIAEYPPASTDCVPGGAITIDKLAGPLGTAPGSPDFVDDYTRPAGVQDVTWQVSVKNLTDYTLFDIAFVDDIAPSCVTAFNAAVQTNATGSFMDPQEELVFTCDTNVGDATVTNTARTGGFDLWGLELKQSEDDAATSTTAALGSIGDTVWTDTNSNGVQDGGEQGYAGATVRLTLPDSTTIDTTTDANGNYMFSNLAPGRYTVELVIGSIPLSGDSALTVTTASSFTIELASGQMYLDADFGIVNTLPKTGIDTETIVIISVSLLLLGGLAVLATTRRKQEEDHGTAVS